MIEIRSGGIELVSTGFTVPEIDQILLDPEPAGEEIEEEGEGDEQDFDHVSRLGDMFRLGRHHLLCGDALDETAYRQVLEGREANAVVSDPPYNCKIEGFVSGLGQHKHADFEMACGEKSDEEFTDFLAAYLGHCQTVSSKGAIIYAFMDFRQIDLLLLAGRRVGLTRNNVCVWNKGSGAAAESDYHTAVRAYSELADAYEGIGSSAEAAAKLAEWKKDGDVQKEIKAGEKLAEVPALIDEMDYDKAYKTCRAVGSKFKGTRTAERALERAEELKTSGMLGFDKNCTQCRTERKACERHAK